jgi:hypothetical protein
MRSLMLLATLFWLAVFVMAARVTGRAQSPVAAYAGAIASAAAVVALGLSLLVIWLAVA